MERENGGDVAGTTALFEPDAVVDIDGGTFLRGKEAIQYRDLGSCAAPEGWNLALGD